MSPFTLTYGTETIIPIEIGMPTLRTEILKGATAEVLAKDLDMSRTEILEGATAEVLAKDLDMTDELCEAIVVLIWPHTIKELHTYTIGR